MKITCTESEKKTLISIIRAGSDCSFLNRAERCGEFESCAECVEQGFDWQIEGGDEDG